MKARFSRILRHPLLVLLICAAPLFVAGSRRLALPALDDCFYAQKAVEMSRFHSFFTVTWAGTPTFQNPPLQIFLVSLAFQTFGVNDLSARLPSILMGLALLGVTYRVGCHLVGRRAALVGAALLLATPLFVDQARRCMMDLPLGFWVSLAILIAIEAEVRPLLVLLVGLPIAAAVLTKSVLGLQALLAVAMAWLLLPSVRRSLWARYLILSTLAGLALGCSWYLAQLLSFGAPALREHFIIEIAGRALGPFDLRQALTYYPRVLVTEYQPLTLFAALGVLSLGRITTPGLKRNMWLLVAWALAPVLICSLSRARLARYLFPVIPALALLAGAWFDRWLPRVGRMFARSVIPMLALLVSVAISINPRGIFTPDSQEFKNSRTIQSRMAPDQPLLYLGPHYWRFANPILYYQKRILEMTSSPAQAISSAMESARRLLLVDAGYLAFLQGASCQFETVARGHGWALVRLRKQTMR